MTEFLATKQDLAELRTWTEARFTQVDARFEALERHIDIRFSEHSARFDAKLSELGQQLTMRMLLAVGAVSALVRIL